MQLTQHFNLSEFTRSDKADQLHIDNALQPSDREHNRIIQNLKTICTEVLEPLRRYVDVPIIISSGYRCPALNKEVGGVRNSQHITGEAADIAPPTHDAHGNMLSPSQSLSLLREWMDWLEDNLQFDQLIMEHKKQESKTKSHKSSVSHWIHVSYSSTHNRHCVISNIWKR